MAGLPDVSIILDNGAIGGAVQTDDGVCALIGNGEAVTDKIQLADPRVVFNLQDAIDIGISEADNPAMYKQVKEFYDEAGPNTELYVMIVSDAVNQATMNDNTEALGVKRLIDYSQGRVKFYGSFHAPSGSYTPDTTDGIDADVLAAVTNAQVLCEAYYTLQQPLRAVVHGYAFQGVAADVPDLRARTDNRVGVVLGSSADDDTAGIGAYLGRLAKVPVQRKASRVKDGAIRGWTEAFVGEDAVEDFSALGLLHDKGYIVPRTFPTRSGYYWSGDASCSPLTDDYAFLARGRVIDKAQRIAYAVYVNEIDDEVPVDIETGQLDSGFVKYMEGLVEQQISAVMADEISGVVVVIDPDQNVISTNKTQVELRIIPVGYQSEIEVLLGFQNPSTE